MKLIVILSAALLLFTAPAFSELTVEDIEKIRSIVKEETTASETRVKEYISQEIAKVNIKIEEMDKRLNGEIKGLDTHLSSEIKGLDTRLGGEIKALGKRLDQLFTLVLALIAFIAVVIGVPQIIVAMQGKNQRAQDEKIEAQQKQIEALYWFISPPDKGDLGG